MLFKINIIFYQLSDKTFEVSQLQASVDDYQRHISESESKYKCEIAKLKNKNQELQFALEEAQKERLGVTSKPQLSSQAASCNGDFLSEAGSLVSFLLFFSVVSSLVIDNDAFSSFVYLCFILFFFIYFLKKVFSS